VPSPAPESRSSACPGCRACQNTRWLAAPPVRRAMAHKRGLTRHEPLGHADDRLAGAGLGTPLTFTLNAVAASWDRRLRSVVAGASALKAPRGPAVGWSQALELSVARP